MESSNKKKVLNSKEAEESLESCSFNFVLNYLEREN